MSQELMLSIHEGSQSRARRWWLRCLLAGLVLLPGLLGPAPTVAAQAEPIPVLAYYYIWFDPGSWNRAKTDFPLLGRYSSDDPEVMRQHVRWAKQAGIDGFIVSWKSTEKLDRRLQQLIDIAASEQFKLSIIYQGLDFERRPLPIDRIALDLDYFREHFASSPVFDMFTKPMVIWSGTWEFSREEIASVVVGRRDQLLILASEKNVEGYQRLADIVDGDAYYWSSVNPSTFPAYQEKLDAMSEAVHAHKGLWIAPVAPGFDARLIGGSRTVERQNGETLRRQMNAAIKSAPDAIGLISWNEFSENSHIEPSRQYDMRYLEILSDIRGGTVPEIVNLDSSEPGRFDANPGLGRFASMGILGLLLAGSITIIVRRQASTATGGSRRGAGRI